MQALLKRYIRLILEVQLKLQTGDGLSINTETNLFPFARQLADEACRITGQVTTIVETEEGKVVQALTIEPVQKEIFRPPLLKVVMCHLVDLGAFPFLTDENELNIIEDVGRLAQYGCLSEPVFLDRRIAVPWANVPLPSERWATEVFSQTASTEETWSLFATLLRLNDAYGSAFWEEQANLLDYRKKHLNALGQVHLTLIGDGFKLEADQSPATCWAGGRTRLHDGRTFIPTLPIQSIHVALNKESAQGDIEASRSFYLLGKLVKKARFTINDGVVVAYSASEGKQALDAFFCLDEGARRVSEIYIADHDTIESRYLSNSIHPHFSQDITTCIVFGGFSLDTLTTHQTQEDVEASNLNESLVRMIVPIGDSHLSLAAYDALNIEHMILKEGIFCIE